MKPIIIDLTGSTGPSIMAGDTNLLNELSIRSLQLEIVAREHPRLRIEALALRGSSVRLSPETVVEALRAEADRIEREFLRERDSVICDGES